jgi:hypothetical protein
MKEVFSIIFLTIESKNEQQVFHFFPSYFSFFFYSTFLQRNEKSIVMKKTGSSLMIYNRDEISTKRQHILFSMKIKDGRVIKTFYHPPT